MSEERCETCRFWEDMNDEAPNATFVALGLPEKIEKFGICRRYPLRGGVPDGEHGWPVLMHEEWCGEYQPATTST